MAKADCVYSTPRRTAFETHTAETFAPAITIGLQPLSDLAGMAVEIIRGDTMADTFRSGDFAVINPDDCDISRPGIFAFFDENGTLQIQKVQLIRGAQGRIECSYINPRYKPYELDLIDPVRIVGRVVHPAPGGMTMSEQIDKRPGIFVLPTTILNEDVCIIDEQDNHIVLTVRIPKEAIGRTMRCGKFFPRWRNCRPSRRMILDD
jgi:hypothetical protein